MDHSVVIMRNRRPPLTRLERLIGKSAEERRNKRSHLRKAVSALMEEVGWWRAGDSQQEGAYTSSAELLLAPGHHAPDFIDMGEIHRAFKGDRHIFVGHISTLRESGAD